MHFVCGLVLAISSPLIWWYVNMRQTISYSSSDEIKIKHIKIYLASSAQLCLHSSPLHGEIY
jgi:hypothetical protein